MTFGMYVSELFPWIEEELFQTLCRKWRNSLTLLGPTEKVAIADDGGLL